MSILFIVKVMVFSVIKGYTDLPPSILATKYRMVSIF